MGSVAQALGSRKRTTTEPSQRLFPTRFLQVFGALGPALGPAPSAPANPRSPSAPTPNADPPGPSPTRRLHLQSESEDFFGPRVLPSPDRPPPHPTHRYWRGRQTRRWGPNVYPGVPTPEIALSVGGTFFTCALSTGKACLGSLSGAGSGLSPVLAPLHPLAGAQAPPPIHGGLRLPGSALGPLAFTARTARTDLVGQTRTAWAEAGCPILFPGPTVGPRLSPSPPAHFLQSPPSS